MYLSSDSVAAALRQVAALAPGSTLAMTFMLPLELVGPEDRPMAEAALRVRPGRPFASFFTPSEMVAPAREASFREAPHVSGASLARRYYAGRTDGHRPSSVIAATNELSRTAASSKRMRGPNKQRWQRAPAPPRLMSEGLPRRVTHSWDGMS